MKKTKKSLVVFVAATFLLTVANFSVVNISQAAETVSKPDYDGLIVKLKNNSELYNLQLSDDSAEWLLNNYQSNAEIEYVEPNYKIQASILPNDSEYFRQWYLPAINAPQAWEIAQGGRQITVAVLDTGVDIDHPDLIDNIWVNVDEKPYDQVDNDNNGFVDDFYGWNFVNDNNQVKPTLNGGQESAVHHGTVVAGAIGARGNNLIGIAGMSWQVRIMPLIVLDNDGSGNTLAVSRAIDYAISQGVDIINLSFVGADYSTSLQDAITRAFNSDIVVVAAAGNEDNQSIDLDTGAAYPVCNDNSDNMLIGVAAIDQTNRLAHFSNYGSRCVDVVAPGTNFFSTMVYEPNNDSFRALYSGGWSGTSVAAPLVSGLAALIKSVNPNLKAVQIRNIILNTAKNIDAYNDVGIRGKLGNGLIDAGKALKAAQATLTGAVSQKIRQEFYVFAPGPGGGPHIRILDYQGNVLSQWFAYDSDFQGGVHVSTGDVDGDGLEDIIVGLGPGVEPWIRIFDLSGNLKYQWLAYNKSFRGGVNVDTGDVNGDGKYEIVTSPGSGGGPHIRIFDHLGNVINQFMAYVPHFRGGVQVAVGDINNDNIAEIITGAGASGGPHVKVFTMDGNLKSEFMAYAESFLGGVEVEIGDIDNNGWQEIITAPLSGGGPHIRIFKPEGYLISQWFAGDPKYRGGLRLAVGDLSGDNLQQLVIGRSQGSEPQVAVYDWLGNLQKSLLAYNKVFKGGVEVEILKE